MQGGLSRIYGAIGGILDFTRLVLVCVCTNWMSKFPIVFVPRASSLRAECSLIGHELIQSNMVL